VEDNGDGDGDVDDDDSEDDDSEDESRVQSIILSDNNIKGEVPLPLLLQLEKLTVLKLDGNAITMPVDIDEEDVEESKRNGFTSNLRILDLSRTNLNSFESLFGDSVPVSYPELTNLKLAECQLSGPLPSKILSSTKLERVVLDGNSLDGLIPSEWGNLLQLRYLSLNNNKLSGNVPAALGELMNLRFLNLRGNRLRGNLPAALNELSLLEVLDISRQRDDDREGLKGPLLAFNNWRELRRLDLSYNSLTGTIPDNFLKNVDPHKFEYLMLGSNELSGMVPFAPFRSFPVDALYLENNRFDDIDMRLCAPSRGGAVELFGCDAILCSPATYHRVGRQETDEEGCLSCPRALYYGTTDCQFGQVTPEPTRSPVKPPPVSLTPREILEKVYDEAGGEGWTDSDKWMSGSNLCGWFGIQCAEDGVETSIENIFLSGNNLIGSIPSEIFQLEKLSKLSLSKNSVRVEFDRIEHARSLTSLDLSSTGLYSIEGISGAAKLEDLRLEMNKLTGTIPDELFMLTELEQLRLDYNGFTGQLPPEIAKLSELKTLSMDDNDLEGSLPTELLQLTQLSSLRLKSNGFSGTLPGFITEMTSLTFLDLSRQTKSNGGFSGPLIDFADHISLRRLDLSSNRIDGTIPSSFLSGVDSNTFEFANLSSNHLIGTVPASISGLHDIYLQDNYLTVIAPSVCDESHGGPIAQFGCDAVLCRIGTYNSLGRQQSYDTECLSCPMAKYLGSTTCPDAPLQPPTASPTSIGGEIDVDMSEREILERFYGACNGNEWTEKDLWMSDEQVCRWDGIRCDEDGYIVEVILRSNNLDGTVPSLLFHLPKLETLNLDGNSVKMSFEDIGLATSLTSIDLSHTDLTSLKGISKAKVLTDLYVTSNRLKGPFPEEVLQLSTLNRLSLALNQLTGTLPDGIGDLSQLEFLSLHGNDFTGTIPPSLGNLSDLLFLFLQSNSLRGGVPSSFSNFIIMWFLDLSEQKSADNVGLTGPLPDFSDFKSLRRLALNENSFTGTIPSTMLQNINVEDFEYVDVSSNSLTGEIPLNLKNLPLDGVYLADNQLTSIESGFCDNPDNTDNDLIQKYGCDAILCAVGTYNTKGRQEGDADNCQSCPGSGSYLGMTSCSAFTTPSPTPSPIEPLPDVDMSELEVLHALYNTCGGERWHRNDGWMDPSVSHCQWFGIRCMEREDGLAVASVMLSSNNLIGTPPVELYQLRHLETLVLDNNMILFDFTNVNHASFLETLDLSQTGIVSLKGLDKAKSLVELRLDGNNLEGPIPEELLSLTNLQELSIDDNRFNGQVPPAIGGLKNLLLFSAISNFLTGELPQEMEKLEDLVTLHLQQNKLTSIGKPDFNKMKALSFLDLSHNNINGPLLAFDQLTDMRRLDLSFNKFRGPIPTTFLQNTNSEFLDHIDLSSNRLSGNVPSELAHLGMIDLMDNQFSSVASEVCALSEYGCDGIICAAKTCNCLGRQESPDTPCEPCDFSEYMGSSQCVGGDAVSPVQSPVMQPSPPTVPVSERDVLEKFYEQCGGYYWVSSTYWTTSESICKWDGIKCVDGQESVESISLGSNKVTGIPPDDLFRLPNLKKLSLYDNPLRGFDFSQLQYARNLEELLLDGTGIASIRGIGSASSLQKLNLRFNRLSAFPEEILNLQSLRYLNLANNKIAGVVPTAIERMPRLETLLLGGNRLTGELSNARAPPSLKILDLSRNELEGTIPVTFLDKIPSSTRVEVDISQNMLSGSVPAHLNRFDRLNIYLHDNFFESVDAQLCQNSKWNDGRVGLYGCNGLLCPRGQWSMQGRQTTEGDACRHCPDAGYMGSSSCASASNAYYGRSVKKALLGAVVTVMVILIGI